MRIVPVPVSVALAVASAAAWVSIAVAPTSAFAVDYLSADQAAKLMFPDADAFETRALAKTSVRIARKAGATLGYVVVDDVVGKVELISYAVGISADGRVKQIEILAYRESHGFEIRLPAWRKQFVGKAEGSALRVGEDIANISGATLSCTHVTDGVRRIVMAVAEARRTGALT